MGERTDSRKLFQRGRAQQSKALVPVLVLTFGTDRQIPLLDLSKRDGSDGTQAWSEDKQAVFIKHFVGQQTDFEQYSKVY